MKKILFVSSCYPSMEFPQYCIFLEQQAKALVEIGNKVDILIPVKSEDDGKINTYIYNDLKVNEIKYKGSKFNIINPLSNRGFSKQLSMLLKAHKYDIISVHLCTDDILKYIIKTCKNHKTKVIVHFHGLNVWKDYYSKYPIYSSFLAFLRARNLRKVNAIVGVSNKVVKIIKQKIHKVPIFTVYNGVDPNLFYPTQASKDDSEFNFICIANLIPIKGHSYLIQAFQKLVAKYPNKQIKLTIVGRGSDEKNIKQLIDSYSLKAYIEFKGYVSYDNISKLLADSDVFVLPSYYEALGCVYLEAMACRVPIIGCKNMGIDEIVISGENGLLVNPKDSEDLFSKMSSFIENDSLKEKCAYNGYLTVVNNYTWNNSAKALDKVYNLV